MIAIADIEAAASRLAGHAHRTPVLRATAVDEVVGAKVVFKCETFQKVGAFKFRGAFNALSQLLVMSSRSRRAITRRRWPSRRSYSAGARRS